MNIRASLQPRPTVAVAFPDGHVEEVRAIELVEGRGTIERDGVRYMVASETGELFTAIRLETTA